MAAGSSAGSDREQPHACRHTVPERVEAGERPPSTEELETRPALELLGARHRDDPDCPGPRHMCAAAGRDVELLDFNQPQDALALRLLAKRHRGGFSGVSESNRDGTVLPDDPVRFPLDARDLAGRDFPLEIDRRRDRAEVEAHGSHLQQAVERGGQDMLAGVLLHVLEPPGPVDPPVHGAEAGARPRPDGRYGPRCLQRPRPRVRSRACPCRTAGLLRSGRRPCGRARRHAGSRRRGPARWSRRLRRTRSRTGRCSRCVRSLASGDDTLCAGRGQVMWTAPGGWRHGRQEQGTLRRPGEVHR